MAATKWTSFNAEPNEHSSDRIQLLDLQSSPMKDPEAKQTYEDDNGRLGRHLKQPAQNIVMGRRTRLNSCSGLIYLGNGCYTDLNCNHVV